MTAETPIDNSEETFVPEDNSEEIDPEVDDVGEHEGQSSSHPSDDTDDTFWSGNPEELPEGLKPVYKNMQGAFTKRMQRVADLERKYLDSIDAANAVVLSRGQAPEPVAKQEEAPSHPTYLRAPSPKMSLLTTLSRRFKRLSRVPALERWPRRCSLLPIESGSSVHTDSSLRRIPTLIINSLLQWLGASSTQTQSLRSLLLPTRLLPFGLPQRLHRLS